MNGSFFLGRTVRFVLCRFVVVVAGWVVGLVMIEKGDERS